VKRRMNRKGLGLGRREVEKNEYDGFRFKRREGWIERVQS